MDRASSPGARQWMILIVVAAAYTLAFCHRLIVVPLFPQMMSRYALTHAEAGSLLSAFYVTYALIQLPAGALADALPPWTLIRVGLIVVGLASAVFNLAPTYVVALASRLLMGAGVALIYSPALTIVANVFPTHKRGLALGIWESCAGLSSVIVLTGFPLLASRVGYALLQWSLALLVLAPAAGLTALLSDLERAISRGESNLSTQEVMTKTLQGLTEPIWQEGKVWRLLATASLGLLILNGAMAWIPSYLREERGLSAVAVASTSGMFPLAMAVTSPLWGRFADKYGRRKPFVAAGSAALAVSFMVLPFVSQALLTVVVAIIGAGAALAVAPFLALAAETADKRQVGTVMGLAGVAGQIGSALSAFVFGLAYDRWRSFSAVWFVCTIGMVLRVVTVSGIKENLYKDVRQE